MIQDITIKERPVLFSAAMVRAILAGRKTQTRRVGKCQMDGATELGVEYSRHATKGEEAVATYRAFPNAGSARWGLCACPYGIPGDRLWVRETYIRGGNGKPLYCADANPNELGLAWENGFRKTPSIFMRRWESRITLEVTNVRVERLNAISALDAMAEGIEPINYSGQDFWKNYEFKANTPGNYIKAFRWQTDSYCSLWESINGAGSWAKNPWVWVIEFRQINQETPTSLLEWCRRAPQLKRRITKRARLADKFT